MMNSPSFEQFGDDPELRKHFPSTNDVAAAGSLIMALAINDVAIPWAFCCGALELKPKPKWL
jgi:hypothetical protein